AVKSHHPETAVVEAQGGEGGIGRDGVAHHFVTVDHDVADEVDAFPRHACGQQVLVGIGRWRPQYVGDRVGHEAVDLLGHAPVAAAQPGFEVNHGYAELRADH